MSDKGFDVLNIELADRQVSRRVVMKAIVMLVGTALCDGRLRAAEAQGETSLEAELVASSEKVLAKLPSERFVVGGFNLAGFRGFRSLDPQHPIEVDITKVTPSKRTSELPYEVIVVVDAASDRRAEQLKLRWRVVPGAVAVFVTDRPNVLFVDAHSGRSGNTMGPLEVLRQIPRDEMENWKGTPVEIFGGDGVLSVWGKVDRIVVVNRVEKSMAKVNVRGGNAVIPPNTGFFLTQEYDRSQLELMSKNGVLSLNLGGIDAEKDYVMFWACYGTYDEVIRDFPERVGMLVELPKVGK